MPGISPKRAGPVIAFLAAYPDTDDNALAERFGINPRTVRRAKEAYKWGSAMKLNINKIRRDAGLQPRAAIDQATVDDYADDLRAGTLFPPVTVYYDGTSYWLADGFHRVAAAIAAGLKSIHADVKQGDKRDAILFSVGVNTTHGLRRTNEDKRRAVMRLLDDPEWSAWSDREIARRCAVSDPFVGKLRPASICKPLADSSRTVSRNGTTYQQAIGQRAAVAEEPEPARRLFNMPMIIPSANGHHDAPWEPEPTVEAAVTPHDSDDSPCPHCRGTGKARDCL
jgi:hypothetical protein